MPCNVTHLNMTSFVCVCFSMENSARIWSTWPLSRDNKIGFQKNSITYLTNLSSSRPCRVLAQLRATRRQSPVTLYRRPWFPFQVPRTKSIVTCRIWSANFIWVYKLFTYQTKFAGLPAIFSNWIGHVVAFLPLVTSSFVDILAA